MDNESKKDLITFITNLIQSSEAKYQSGDFKGSVDYKREVKKIITQNASSIELKSRFKDLVKESKVFGKYDLIEDYKNRIDDNKKLEIIYQLEKLSEGKYNSGDFKGSIRALRRAEKYY